MSCEQRQKDFLDQVKKHLFEDYQFSPCYGTSNIARIIPGGIILAVVNLANYNSQQKPLCIASRICPFPDAEIYFCAIINKDKESLLLRLNEMQEASANGDSNYCKENNNTSICLAENQEVYLNSKKISEVENPPQDFLGRGIKLDKFFYSIFLKNNTDKKDAILKNIISTLTDYIGHSKATELSVFDSNLQILDRSDPTAINISSIASDFVRYAKTANFQVPFKLAIRFIASLLTKRFVILTGLAGSGKTKLADAFSMWLSSTPSLQTKLVPVGADWTSNENLLGYADALHPQKYCRPSNGALDLILAANNDKSRPFFLILDEMNLSHVERYFSDMLSAVESGKSINLHSSSGVLDGIPASTHLPENLFIIGTVNVDETTYMFSPKVLDRANVLEFRATEDQIENFLHTPDCVDIHSIKGRGSNYEQGFIANAGHTKTRLSSLPTNITDGKDYGLHLKDSLLDAFKILSPLGAEFGFRTAYEISRFVYFHAILTGKGWKFEEALDAQVLQKLLPKLHGSERRVGPILNQLLTYCEKYNLPDSREKIHRMQDRLKDGFTSFSEA